MNNLAIDIGNSSIKMAVFKNNELIYMDKTELLNTGKIAEIQEKHEIENVIISSVRAKKDIKEIEEIVLNKNLNYIHFDHSTQTPIINKYKSPLTLGLDRLAAVIGAQYLYPNIKVLVIDAGTCITYDIINEKAEYYGGSISPGIKMRFDAMHHFTSNLPAVKFDETFENKYGSDTQTSISSGAINGVLYEMEGFIKKEIEINQTSKIILCGGDAPFFDSRFKNSIFAHSISYEPNLVLIGLNTIVSYQNDHK